MSAMQNILSKIPWTPIKRKYIKVWNEFDDNKTETSKLIHFFDKTGNGYSSQILSKE